MTTRVALVLASNLRLFEQGRPASILDCTETGLLFHSFRFVYYETNQAGILYHAQYGVGGYQELTTQDSAWFGVLTRRVVGKKVYGVASGMSVGQKRTTD